MLPKQGKLLALDLGTRRTGVALTDAQQRVAFSRPEIEFKTDEEAWEAIRNIIETEKIVGCVVGVPVKLDRKRTEQTEKVEHWVEKIQSICPVLQMDERLSTEFAKNLNGFKTEDRHWDSRAAQILLENHLNSKTR